MRGGRGTPRWLLSAVGVVLTIYPRAFRRRFGPEIEDTVLLRWAEGPGGVRGALRSVWHLFRLAVAGVSESLNPSLSGPVAHAPGLSRRLMQFLDQVLRDARLAVRSARRRPGFVAVVVCTLALGVGANTAMFSVVNGVILKPLPYPAADRLLSVDARYDGPQPGLGNMSYPDMKDLETLAPAIDALSGISNSNMALTGLDEPEVLSVARVTRGLMDIFGVAPTVGRDIRADEFGPDGPYVAVISHAFWRDRFGSDPGVLGATITLSEVSYEVVGVAPPGFAFPGATAVWTPRRLDVADCARGCHTLAVVGRLAHGATLATARDQADQIADRLRESYRDTNLYKSFSIITLQDRLVGGAGDGLVVMLGAVGLVLLIACANVATLLLVRGMAVRGDVGVRRALGATRRRIVTASLVESSLLAAFGGVVGLLLAGLIVKGLPVLAAGRIPRLDEVSLDGAVLAFAATSVLVVTVLFGLAPALSAASSPGAGAARKLDSGPSHRRLRAWILGTEVALSVFLLVGAGLMVKTVRALAQVELGYDPDGIVRFTLSLPGTRYGSIEEVVGFYDGLEEEIRSIPGVRMAGSAWGGPMAPGRATGDVLVEGRPSRGIEDVREAAIRPVGPGWLETMGIPLLRGRPFTPEDHRGGEPVALVTESLARMSFPDEEVIGSRMGLTVDLGYGSPTYQIVGVVADYQDRALVDAPRPGLVVPRIWTGPGTQTVAVKVEEGAASPLPRIREIVADRDPALAMYRIETVEQAVDRDVAPARFFAILTGAFAALAALLAGIGLYGVAAFAASRRTREIGLRVALGAERRGIVALVLGQGMRPAVGGLMVGLLGSYLGAGVMESLLFGVDPRDPAVFAISTLLLAGVATGATLLPASRAARLDPVSALRAN